MWTTRRKHQKQTCMPLIFRIFLCLLLYEAAFVEHFNIFFRLCLSDHQKKTSSNTIKVASLKNKAAQERKICIYKRYSFLKERRHSERYTNATLFFVFLCLYANGCGGLLGAGHADEGKTRDLHTLLFLLCEKKNK